MLEGPCNGLRDNLVKKEVRLVNKDEYCTSKECYQCGDLMNKTRFFEYENGLFAVSNGILSCGKCKMSLNRDINGADNIYHLVYNHLNGIVRPTWLSRT
jgi:transposase